MLMRPYADLRIRCPSIWEHRPRVAIIDPPRHVAIEFCRRTGCWVESMTLDSPAHESVLQADLPLLQSRICRTLHRPPRRTVPSPSGTCRPTAPSFRTKPLNRRHPLYLRVNLAPSTQSLDGPEVLFEDWADAIVSGVVARLQMQPGREWSQPNMAAVHQQRFEQGGG